MASRTSLREDAALGRQWQIFLGVRHGRLARLRWVHNQNIDRRMRIAQSETTGLN